MQSQGLPARAILSHPYWEKTQGCTDKNILGNFIDLLADGLVSLIGFSELDDPVSLDDHPSLENYQIRKENDNQKISDQINRIGEIMNLMNRLNEFRPKAEEEKEKLRGPSQNSSGEPIYIECNYLYMMSLFDELDRERHELDEKILAQT